MESVLNQLNLVYSLTPHLFKIPLILSSHLDLDLPSGLLASGFLSRVLCAFHFSHMPDF